MLQDVNLTEMQQISDLKSKIEEVLGAISKLPSDEALERVRNLKVQYLATNGGPSMEHTGRKLKSWLYPALAFMLNGGYYIDYAGMLETMGLPVMHQKMWDGLVSSVGGHVEHLAR